MSGHNPHDNLLRTGSTDYRPIQPRTPSHTLNSTSSQKGIRKASATASPTLAPQTTHAKQYVLLGSKATPQPQLESVNSNPNLSKKVRPMLHKQPSSRYIFSVDDDEEEIEADINREYYEGFSDALRMRFNKKHSGAVGTPLQGPPQKPPSLTAANSATDNVSQASGASRSRVEEERMANQELEQHIASTLEHVANDIRSLEEREGDEHERQRRKEPLGEHYEQNQTMDGNISDDNDGGDDNDSISSSSSLESFTLRERQDAINETHPFGIKIWKPALYKKKRSVQRDAEADIHESSASTVARHVSWPIQLGNVLWICTFGVMFFILCLFGTILCTIFSLLSVLARNQHSNSVQYSKLLYQFGLYMLNPFGKIVLLAKDDNYLEEDLGEGRSVSEYQRWRSEEEGRLFYAPRTRPRAYSSNVAYGITPATVDNGNLGEDDVIEVGDEGFKRRLFGRGDWNIGRVIFYFYYYSILQPVIYLVALICWLMVLPIPMSKICVNLTSHLRRHPLGLSFDVETRYNSRQQTRRHNNASILLCTYRSFGLHYYKYTVDGTNIFFINMIFLVVFVIFDFYFLKEFMNIDNFFTNADFIFFMCLASVIPLAYYIGQAVASISAQTSMGVGAVINAFFSTVVEVFLYCVALNQGKGALVEGSMIGSILAAVLLLPGLSMCGGALKRKTQRYNPKSAGVSSTMLLFAIVVMCAPTLFYQIYGEYEIKCDDCEEMTIVTQIGIKSPSCQRCYFYQPPLTVDRLYLSYLKPFSVICAIGLFSAYAIGLWFTLRTHAALIWTTPTTSEKPKSELQQNANGQIQNQSSNNNSNNQPPQSPSLRSISLADLLNKPSTQNIKKTIISQQQQQQQHQQQQESKEEGEGGHDAPNWSRAKSTVILLGATFLYAVIAEILVDTVDSVLQQFPINPKFLGLTVFALVPNTTEFVNAISFAIHGNVALSMEIGSAYALQVCLLQVPTLVIYSIYDTAVSHSNDINSMFTLIFPKWDIIASIISIFLFTYIYAEGKSNYFKGTILILIYLVVMAGFYFAGAVESSGLSSGEM